MKRASGLLFTLILIFAAPAFAQRYTVFPQFASGGGWSSVLFFTNQGIEKVSSVTVSFLGDYGDPLPVASNLGSSSQFVFDLNPGTSQKIEITPPADLVTGYVLVEYPSYSAPVRGSLVYRYESGGTVQVEVGVAQQEQGNHYSFPVEVNSSKNINTAIALINPMDFNDGVDETVVVTLINPDGSIHALTTVPMEAGLHISQYIDQDGLFPGLDNFTGTISISSPLGLGVLALRQDKQAFGAISTDTGPILGPFAVNAAATKENEPNNNTANAQSVASATLISGTISTSSDADVYKIQGNAGDILSVICTTQGLTSDLDSYLVVRDSAQNLIAQNDDNGLTPQLYPSMDAFIQLELPADGAYYITVTDTSGNGGSTYTYKLHVRLQ